MDRWDDTFLTWAVKKIHTKKRRHKPKKRRKVTMMKNHRQLHPYPEIPNMTGNQFLCVWTTELHGTNESSPRRGILAEQKNAKTQHNKFKSSKIKTMTTNAIDTSVSAASCDAPKPFPYYPENGRSKLGWRWLSLRSQIHQSGTCVFIQQEEIKA